MKGNMELKLHLSHDDVRFLRNKIIEAADLKIKVHLPFQTEFEKENFRN